MSYDLEGASSLRGLRQPISSIFASTSSNLFRARAAAGFSSLVSEFRELNPEALILKENRGGSRMHIYASGKTVGIGAQLAMKTVNSVGVGDVYDAVFVANRKNGLIEAAWRAAYASSAYAQTTEPDLFRDHVRRDTRLTLQELSDLGGVWLPWECRSKCDIYLAAPDFSDVDTTQIERAVSALQYHNFSVRRPVKENGELPPRCDLGELRSTYQWDVNLLRACKLVFAVPTSRDPGTLVEIGLAISRNIPVVVYDPLGECSNTMVIAGADCYSGDLGVCLNATFELLSKSIDAEGPDD